MRLRPKKRLPHRLYRWRFDFPDKEPKFGGWNDPDVEAWNINKTGLARASIEILREEGPKTVVECDGHEFVNFKWVAVKGFATPFQIIGLTLVGRDNEITVYTDGRHEDKQRTDEDKTYHYAGFGR